MFVIPAKAGIQMTDDVALFSILQKHNGLAVYDQ